MTELIKQITVSLSEKIQAESYGGPKYTSFDLFESESEQVPATFDSEECQVVWNVLRRRVEARIGERKRELIASLQGRPYTPIRVESHHSPSATPTPLKTAPTASREVRDTGSGVAKTPFRRVPANSVPATPPVKVPDGPDGTPFAS